MKVCERCGNNSASIHLSREGHEHSFCPDCFNDEMVAAEMELKLETYPDSISVQDGRGIDHIFIMEKIVMSGVISMKATEDKENSYSFTVLGELDCDQNELFQRLVKKVKKGIAKIK